MYCFCDGRKKYHIVVQLYLQEFKPRAEVKSVHAKKKSAVLAIEELENAVTDKINYYQILSIRKPFANSLLEIESGDEIFNYAKAIENYPAHNIHVRNSSSSFR